MILILPASGVFRNPPGAAAAEAIEQAAAEISPAQQIAESLEAPQVSVSTPAIPDAGEHCELVRPEIAFPGEDLQHLHFPLVVAHQGGGYA